MFINYWTRGIGIMSISIFSFTRVVIPPRSIFATNHFERHLLLALLKLELLYRPLFLLIKKKSIRYREAQVGLVLIQQDYQISRASYLKHQNFTMRLA